MTTITLINQMMEFISRNQCFRQILILLFLYAYNYNDKCLIE